MVTYWFATRLRTRRARWGVYVAVLLMSADRDDRPATALSVPRVDEADGTRIPLHVEDVSVAKQRIVTSRVKVTTLTRDREKLVDEGLTREHVEVERVPIDALKTPGLQAIVNKGLVGLGVLAGSERDNIAGAWTPAFAHRLGSGRLPSKRRIVDRLLNGLKDDTTQRDFSCWSFGRRRRRRKPTRPPYSIRQGLRRARCTAYEIRPRHSCAPSLMRLPSFETV